MSAIFLPSRSFGFADAGLLEHVDGVRRLGVDDGNELDRDLVVAAAENDRGGIGKADLGRAGCNLLHRVRRSLAAHDLNVEILPGVVALFERNEIIGVPAVVAEIGDEGHLVGGHSLICAERACQERREHRADTAAAPCAYPRSLRRAG